jgi:hypothetical protein
LNTGYMFGQLSEHRICSIRVATHWVVPAEREVTGEVDELRPGRDFTGGYDAEAKVRLVSDGEVRVD